MSAEWLSRVLGAATHLSLALNMRTHSCMSKVRHAAQVAVFHSSQFDRTATDRVVSPTGQAIDAVCHCRVELQRRGVIGSSCLRWCQKTVTVGSRPLCDGGAVERRGCCDDFVSLLFTNVYYFRD